MLKQLIELAEKHKAADPQSLGALAYDKLRTAITGEQYISHEGRAYEPDEFFAHLRSQGSEDFLPLKVLNVEDFKKDALGNYSYEDIVLSEKEMNMRAKMPTLGNPKWTIEIW